jgi:hypothetical protein
MTLAGFFPGKESDNCFETVIHPTDVRRRDGTSVWFAPNCSEGWFRDKAKINGGSEMKRIAIYYWSALSIALIAALTVTQMSSAIWGVVAFKAGE